MFERKIVVFVVVKGERELFIYLFIEMYEFFK